MLASACRKLGGMFMQMEDEIASIAAVIGASLAGAKAFTATSGPGFSLMQENLGLAVMGEVPCVVVNVQRAGPSTGLATKPAQSDIMQVRWGRHGDQSVIALCPATVRECFTLTVQAFNFAERFRVPVILMPDEIVGHMRENVALPLPGELEVIDRKAPSGPPAAYLPFKPDADGVAPLAAYGGDYVFHVTSSMHGTDGYSNNDPANAAWRVRQLHEKIERHRDEIVLTQTYYTEDMDVLIVTFGATTRAGARGGARSARAGDQGRRAAAADDLALSRQGSGRAGKQRQDGGRAGDELQRPGGRRSAESAGQRRRSSAGSTATTGTIITPQDILDVRSPGPPAQRAKGASRVARNGTAISEARRPAAHVVLGLRHRRHARRPAARVRGTGLQQQRYRRRHRHRLHRQGRRLSGHQCAAHHARPRAGLCDGDQGVQARSSTSS